MCEISCHGGSTVPPVLSSTDETPKFSFLLTVLFIALVVGGLVPHLVAQAPTPVTVPTWRYDLTHAGQNTTETALTPANVNASTFGKLFSLAVDGSVYAQPLFVPGLTMGDGLVHNVLFIATEHDSIYAFDADSNGGANVNPIWHITLLDTVHGAGAGATTVPWTDTGSPDIAPEIGITGTPFIDTSTNTMYVVGKTKENGTYFTRLHAINILTGVERANSPVAIQGTVAGTGNGSSGGQLSFSPLWQNNRPSLNYYNGYVYIGFGAHGDNGPWHGWLFAYNATTLAQASVVCTSPNGFGNGVWMAGSGMPIDTSIPGGRMFLATGNGTYASYPPFNASNEFGDSIVAFDLTNGKLAPVDAFTPFNQGKLSTADLDQGSGGILMMPNQQGANQHILMQSGKEGRILVLNRDHLGGYATGVTSNTNALQDILNQAGGGLWSTPAYWNGNVYIWAKADVPKMFKVNSGVLDTTPSSKAAISSAYPGASFTVSSDGTQNGIAWAVRTDQFTTHGPQVLYAFDANDLSNVLYESDTNSARDGAGHSMKFAIPVVTNGKVYVAALGEIDVYGLYNGSPTAVAPTITPDGGTFGGTLSVTLSTTTASANIFYTLDGSVPTPASPLYTGQIAISGDTTIRAIASAENFVQSAVSSATFHSVGQTPAITFMPGAGTYTAAQVVTLSDTDANAAVYYTTDGSTPTASSKLYSGPIAVAASMTIKAIAIDGTLANSNVGVAPYVIQAGGSSIDFGNGFASVAGLTLNGSTINTDDSRLQLTNAGTYQAGSVFWNQPIGIQTFTTDFLFQLSSAQGDGFTFTIQGVGATALGASGSGLGYQNIAKSVAVKFDLYSNSGEGTDSTGVYINGAAPTVPAVDMSSSGVNLRSGDSIQAHITYDGTTLKMNLLDLVTNKTFVLTNVVNIPQIVGSNAAYIGFTGSTGGLTASQKILYWTYVTQAPSPATSNPVFSPAAGSYATPPSVTLSDSTAGAVIYYTINGTAPTTSSFVYTSPIVPGIGTTGIEAMAVAPGSSQSAVVTATYVVGSPVTAPPTFTPGAGTYTTRQSVVLADSTAGAVMYYTTDGTTPTTSSAVYSTPINVAVSETIKAIAIASNAQPSATAAAAYAIQTAGSTINFPNGFPSVTGLTLNGSAINTANLLQLTSTTGSYQDGSVFWNQLVGIQTFTTDFSFQLSSAQGDGFTFAIQGIGATAVGATGSGLGYQNIAKSIAIKFDLYSNAGEGADSTGIYINGAVPTVPAVDMTSSGVLLKSGDSMLAHITYDGTTLTMNLLDMVTNTSFVLTKAINIPQVIGSSVAYVGFTGSTGGLTAVQKILSWTYSTQAPGPATAAPMFTPPAGSYTTPQNITLNSATAGAVIYYTTNGTTPTTSSPIYAGAIAVAAGTTTIEAMAVASGYSQSTVATATYLVGSPVTAAPTFNPVAGTYSTAQSVTLSDSTAGAVIHYTINGTIPTAASPVYTGAIAVTASQTIEAIAIAPNAQASAMTSAAYTIQTTGSTINFPNGFTSAAGLSLNGSATVTSNVLQLTWAGAAASAGAAWFTTPVNITGFITDFNFQLLSAKADGFTFAIQNAGVTAIGPNGSGLGYGASHPGGTGGIARSVAVKFDLYSNDGESPDSTGFYTNGASPTTPATDMTASGVALNSGHIMHAHITYDGTNLTLLLTDTVTGASFVTASALNIPSIVGSSTGYIGFTAGTGGLSMTADILNWTVTAGSANAAIQPAIAKPMLVGDTAANARVLSAFSGASLESLSAPLFSSSPQQTTEQPVFAKTHAEDIAPEPRFLPDPGVFAKDTVVTLRCDTPGAVIHYTFDGSQPVASSPVYRAPISVKGTELTIKAFASLPDRKDSAVVTGIYRIRD
ncbi:MAG: chitobiase/beta-hexosaminidase C-terminal domain-containing protein [Candidatus Sulfotelmatobacter sp.]